MITAFALALALQGPVYAGVDLRAKNLPIRQALAQLGRQQNNATFNVPANVKGNVDAIFVNLPYQMAVNRVLAQVGAACKDVLGVRIIGANNRPVGHVVEELGRIETPVTLKGDMEIRTALRNLFKQVDRSYTVESTVQGDVRVDADAQPFSTVLNKTLAQVASIYVVESDIYEIVSTRQPLPPEGLSIQIQRFVSAKERRYDALRRLARTAGVTFEIDPGVELDQRVNIDLGSAPLSTVLPEVLGPKATFFVENGVCRIVPVGK